MQDIQDFVAAVKAKDVEATRRLLLSREDVRLRVNEPIFDFGQRAAHIAVNDRALLELLIAHGADVNLRSDWKNGPYSVLDNAEEPAARFLIARGATLTPHVAARLGWIDELRTIVEANPSAVHDRGGDGQQPLHLARTAEIADYLLDHGAEVDARCVDHHSTPAQYALTERSDVCRRLLQRGAAPDIFMAAYLGDSDLAERLVQADASCLAARINEPGYPPVAPFNIYCWLLGFHVSPQEVASARGHTSLFEWLMLRSSPRVRLLVAAQSVDESLARNALREDDALPASLTRAEHAQLALAIFHGRFEAADLMLRLGFDPAAPGIDGGTALHAACWMGSASTVTRLLERGGIPIDLPDPTHGSTPLGWAAFGSVHRRADGADYVGVIERLVAAGARVDVAGNGAGWTLVRMAEGNATVQNTLRRLGAA